MITKTLYSYWGITNTSDANIGLINYDNNNDEFAYVNIQKKFIWGDSALYLLGPEPLFWLTLFAVNVHDSSITIHLPCLCNDALMIFSLD